MINCSDWQQINKQIELTSKQSFSIINTHPVSGGCINSAFVLQGKNKSYFIKLNRANLLPMFKAEFLGLKEIAQSDTVKVPNPLLYGSLADKAFLIMEYLSLKPGTRASDALLGQHLAKLHKIPQAYFGWQQNNTIGSTEQINTSSNNWINFWQENRLGFQLSIAESNGYAGRLTESGAKLAESISYFFYDYNPQASLLHGDLWSGNAAISEQGEPIIFDPACYYGDREADIAMTELFGGYGRHFYDDYNQAYPLHSGYKTRKQLYNLYHILNHLNLFGEGYLRQAQDMIDYLLSEISA